MSDLKLLSVVIPAYNVEKFLVKCVESIVNQSYKNIEIVIVNNGSQDNTPQLCDELANKYNNIKVINLSPNQGVNYARRSGVENSTGEYITFIDSDDYIDLNAYERAVKVLEENNCDIVQFGYYSVRPDGGIISEFRRESAKIEGARNAFAYFLYDLPQNSVLVWDKVYKRELFNDLEWPRLTWAEDFCTNAQLFAKSKKFMAISENFYYHVIHNEQVSYSLRTGKDKICNDMAAMKFLKDFTARAMPDCLPEMLFYVINLERYIFICNIISNDTEINNLLTQCMDDIKINYNLMRLELKAQRRRLNIKLKSNWKNIVHTWLLIYTPRFYKFYLTARLKHRG